MFPLLGHTNAHTQMLLHMTLYPATQQHRLLVNVSVTRSGSPVDEELTSCEPNLILPSASVGGSFLSWQTHREETGPLLSFSNCYKNIFRAAVMKIRHITILSYEKLIL